MKEEEPAREDAFKKGMMDALKKIEANFDNWQFFMGESMNPDGMVALMDFRDDGSPYMWFFKDGTVEEKVVSTFMITELTYLNLHTIIFIVNHDPLID